MAASPTITSPTPISRCSPASSPAACGRPFTSWTVCMKNISKIQPDTLHADTQGQSEPVFGLCRLLGDQADAAHARHLRTPSSTARAKSFRYQHIDALFGGDDRLGSDRHARARHVPGRAVDPGGARSCHRCCCANSAPTPARASCIAPSVNSGRVERTLFLLRLISNSRSPADHSRRNHQDRSLQRFPRLDLFRRSGRQKR